MQLEKKGLIQPQAKARGFLNQIQRVSRTSKSTFLKKNAFLIGRFKNCQTSKTNFVKDFYKAK